MKFDFLYNSDNGMAFPWTQVMADEHKDLIAVTDSELQRIAREGASISDILSARTAQAEAEVTIEVPAPTEVTQEPPTTAQDAPMEPKGIVAPPEMENTVAPVVDVFGNERRDYRGMASTVTVEDFDSVSDEDLVRFAREALGKDVGVPPDGTEDEVAEWYALIRKKLRKLVEKTVKNRDRRAALKVKEQGNGGND